MSAVALLMAGGRGERMRASGVALPKPLVPVRGVPLLERSLCQLIRHGLLDVVVAVPTEPTVIGEFVQGRLTVVARAAGARVRVLTETTPLGNIGCARQLQGQADPLLVVYADNLTTLDLGAVLDHHRCSNAVLTLAAHDHPFRLPYGRLELVGDRVTAYAEKPTLPVTVCSAVSVLAPAAMAALPAGRAAGLVDLTTTLLRAGELVTAFRHAAPWVDVNDADGVRLAERLVDEQPDDFPLVDGGAAPTRS